MTAQASKKLEQLQQVDFAEWALSMWLVKRRLDNHKEGHYAVLSLDLDDKLQAKLRDALAYRAQGHDYELEAYDFLTADEDDKLLTLDANDTDFSKIQLEIDQGLANKKVEHFDELLDSWAFVVKLELDGKAIYGVKKISKFTQATRIAAVSYFFFEDQKLVDLEDKRIFSFDIEIDFFVFEGVAFIKKKKEFESAMNFRVGMERNRDTVLSEMVELQVFTNIEPIRKMVGANIHLLRKMSAIQKSAYYKDEAFMSKLIKLNQEENWNLVIEDEKIVVTEENVDLVLTLLNNSRLKSPINDEVFDAAVKKKVG